MMTRSQAGSANAPISWKHFNILIARHWPYMVKTHETIFLILPTSSGRGEA
jgi:hypothetical protein